MGTDMMPHITVSSSRKSCPQGHELWRTSPAPYQLEHSGKVDPAPHLYTTAEFTLVIGNIAEITPRARAWERWPCHSFDVRCHGFRGDALQSREMAPGS